MTASESWRSLLEEDDAFWLRWGASRYGLVVDGLEVGLDDPVSLAGWYRSLAIQEALNGNELLAFDLFSPEAVGELYGVESRGSPADIFLFAFSGGLVRGAGEAAAFSADQRALVALAKEAQRRGISREEAEILLQWAEEYGVAPALDHTAPQFAAHFAPRGQPIPHIRIGPARHIPVLR